MKFKRNLMVGLIGLAMFAVPIAAAANENDHGQNNPHQEQSHNNAPASHPHDSAPAARNESHDQHRDQHNDEHNARNQSRDEHSDQHSARSENRGAPVTATHNESRDRGSARSETRNENRNVAPETATRSESRDQRGARTASAETEHRDSREVRGDTREGRDDRNQWNRDPGHDRDYSYWGHRDDDRDYAEGAPSYDIPYGYSGGACAWARHLRNVIYYDRSTGHPAAASDLIPALHRAERRCGGVPYGYGYYR